MPTSIGCSAGHAILADPADRASGRVPTARPDPGYGRSALAVTGTPRVTESNTEEYVEPSRTSSSSCAAGTSTLIP